LFRIHCKGGCLFCPAIGPRIWMVVSILAHQIQTLNCTLGRADPICWKDTGFCELLSV
jgi:hypothetical protein